MAKFLSPKDVSDMVPYSIRYIRDNAPLFGLGKLTDKSRKWLGEEEMVHKAISKLLCSTNAQTQSFTTSRSSTVVGQSSEALIRQLREKLNGIKNG